MLRAVVPRLTNTAKAMKNTRSFSGIVSDMDFHVGRRGEEIKAEATGEVGFNRDPIIPAANMGTKENPILVINFKIYIKIISFTILMI